MASAIKTLIKKGSLPLLRALSFKGRKTFSAMFRVRNEEEFLYPAVAAIAEHVEQIVIVDNLSDDDTPAIIRQLQREFPEKISSYIYPHKIARPGEENKQLASTPEGRRSPRLLANYYNWCLSKCSQSFIVKWDGDTVALPSFLQALEQFRTSPAQSMWIAGVNVHPQRQHTVKAPSTPLSNEREPWYIVQGRERHIRPYEDYEPRIFPRRFATYTNNDVICESLWTPYAKPPFALTYAPMAYLHFKHCKRELYSNISPEMKPAEEARWEPGDPLDQEMLECIRYWHLEATEKEIPQTCVL